MRVHNPAAFVALLLVPGIVSRAEEQGRPTAAGAAVLRFDCGTDESPLAAGFRRVTAETMYSEQNGFGWVGQDSKRSAFYRQTISPYVAWKDDPSTTAVDGVASEQDLVFRADLPNGRYRVEVVLGDMGGLVPAGMGRFLDTGVRGEESGGPGGPLYSLAVQSNGERKATDLEARTLPHRGAVACKQLIDELPRTGMSAVTLVRLGNSVRAAFDQQVSDGNLVLRFYGDQARYDRALRELKAITNPAELRRRLYIAGGPFTRNSVLSIVVYPAPDEPLVEEAGKLRVAGSKNALLEQFAEAFNQGKLPEAHELALRLPHDDFAGWHARLLARLWLLGHPNHWRERDLLAGVAEELTAAGQNATPAQREHLRFLRDRLHDFQMGVMNFDQRTHDGQEVVPSMNRAEGYFARAQPGEPLYWKSQLYRARIWYSMDPNRKAQLWPLAQQIVEQLDRVYAGNRWADYYLRKDPRGWPLVDYRTQTQGAPTWAGELHAYYNRMLDLSRWWIDNRQDPKTTAVGGEWGDDVEFMPWLGYMTFICPDAAPEAFAGAVRFCDGAWSQSGIVDTFNGFFHITSDAEHSAEFTGNVLGMMEHLRPGDPECIERSLKTGKLMRDLWMGRNARGQRLFRSSYLGAFEVPVGPEHGDTAICNRAILPALNVVELNRNPEIARLITEYADTLLALAKSTDKGKPMWVLPGSIVYETGELGHTGSKEWWLAPRGLGQEMFSFPGYHGFRLQILSTAWRLTGNKAYLEPIQREAEMAAQVPEDRDAPKGSLAWSAAQLRKLGVPDVWNGLKAELDAADIVSQGVLLEKGAVGDEARKLSEVARKRWPMMTDDATMTDRVLFHGCNNSVIWYSGARLTTQQVLPAISYEGPGRDFAALVLKHNPQYVKLLYYGFHNEARRVRIRFWELQPHGTYRLTTGIDSDGDDAIDRELSSQELVLREPSGGVELLLPPRQTVVLEVTPLRRATAPELVTDPAIAPRDIHYDPRGHLLVDVHNLGNQPAENVSVSFYEGHHAGSRKLLGRTIVSYIEPPNRLVPQVVRTGIEWSPTADSHQITVVLDEEGRIDELFERNNEAQVSLGRTGQVRADDGIEPQSSLRD